MRGNTINLVSNNPGALHKRLLKAKIMNNREDRLLGVEKYGLVASSIRGCLSKKERFRIEGTSHDFGEAEVDKKLKKD